MSEIFVDNEYVTLGYNSETQTVFHTFHQFIQGKDLYDALNTGIDVLREKGAVKWLSDDRKNTGVTPEDTDWSMNDWGPRAAQAGWKYWALVVPEELAGRGAMSGIVEQFFNLGVQVMVFTEVKEAQDWLNAR